MCGAGTGERVRNRVPGLSTGGADRESASRGAGGGGIKSSASNNNNTPGPHAAATRVLRHAAPRGATDEAARTRRTIRGPTGVTKSNTDTAAARVRRGGQPSPIIARANHSLVVFAASAPPVAAIGWPAPYKTCLVPGGPAPQDDPPPLADPLCTRSGRGCGWGAKFGSRPCRNDMIHPLPPTSCSDSFNINKLTFC